MLKFPKRKTDGADAAVPPWRPNFRNEQKLPDVKVIRTSFFLNAGVFALLVAGVLYVSYVEIELSALREQTAAARDRIEKNQAVSDNCVAIYKLFQEEEKRVSELDAFMSGRQAMREIVMGLGELIPTEMALSNLEVSDQGIKLQGFVSGLPTKASGYASSFEKSLKESKLFGTKFDQIKLTSLGRDQNSGRMRFTMDLTRAKPEQQKKGKK